MKKSSEYAREKNSLPVKFPWNSTRETEILPVKNKNFSPVKRKKNLIFTRETVFWISVTKKNVAVNSNGREISQKTGKKSTWNIIFAYIRRNPEESQK